MRVLTDEEVIQRYGDPQRFIRADGHIDAMWEEAILGSFKLPASIPLSFGGVASRVRCHRRILPAMQAAFGDLFKDQDAWKSVNDFGGCYMWRMNKNNRKKLSRHCWGIAIDLDVVDNPNGSKGEMHPGVVAAFERHGFVWGAHFPTPDPMHFEIGV